MTPQLALACQESLGLTDGIRDYTFSLFHALVADARVAPLMVLRGQTGMWNVQTALNSGAASLSHLDELSLRSGDAIILQYNPFLYGRRGFAPWLPLSLARLRKKSPEATIALMVHEAFVPTVSCRWALMGSWQRLQLAVTRLSADLVFVPTQHWASRLRHFFPSRPTKQIPVGSNLPDMRATRLETRRSMGLADAIVLGTFGQNHPSHLRHYAVAAANTLARDGRHVALLDLGSNAVTPPGIDPQVSVSRFGPLSAAELARYLAAVDIFLGPFSEGASTRRTTLMAALQHGLPIVTTLSPFTDSVLIDSGAMRFAPIGRPDVFSRMVLELAADPSLRLGLGQAARRAYDDNFAWPVIAARILGELGLLAS